MTLNKLKIKSPLADRMRPLAFDDVLGQSEVIGKDSALRKAIAAGHVPSMILWGPPGCGKTTLARILANEADADFLTLSAVSSGVADLRKIVAQAEENKKFNRQTILFIDEIHRWNKAQQDRLLPFIENGTLILIGATTENPSFEVISALLSRSQVYVLKPLKKEEIIKLLKDALKDNDRGLGDDNIQVSDENIELIAQISGGDARVGFNILEIAARSGDVSKESIKSVAQKTNLIYDKKADEYYNIISAFIKSVRGSDENAAVYWLARMLEGGQDPMFIARRMVVLASEDIGNALPTAGVVASCAMQAVHMIGMPEARIILSQCAIYLCRAPKSNEAYSAIEKAIEEVRHSGALPVPLHIRNAPTEFMKDLGYAKDYIYSHNDLGAYQQFLPDEIKDKTFTGQGTKKCPKGHG